MARRSDHNRDELKQLAVDAGRMVIAGEGFANLSTRKIAKEIGYTVGTLYNLFDGFDDLILHVNIVTLKEITANIEGKNTAFKIADEYYKYAVENTHLWQALYEHKLPEKTELPEWYQDVIDNIFSIIEHSLEGEIEDDVKRKQASHILWAGLHGITSLYIDNKLDVVRGANVKTLIDDFMKNYLAGVKG